LESQAVHQFGLPYIAVTYAAASILWKLPS